MAHEGMPLMSTLLQLSMTSQLAVGATQPVYPSNILQLGFGMTPVKVSLKGEISNDLTLV